MTARIYTGILPAVLAVASLAASAAGQGINTREMLTKGERVPALRGFGSDGKSVTIDYGSQTKPTVVYVVKVLKGTITGFGKDNEANFAALVRQAGDRFHFVLVVPEDDGGLLSYVAKARSGWGTTRVTIMANVPDDVRQAYAMFVYPQTLVISTEARVLESFQGVYTVSGWKDQTPEVIQRFFGITLPPAKGQ